MALSWQLRCSDCEVLGSGCGAELVVKLLGGLISIGMVSSSWLAALCKQLLCLNVIARYLGSGCGLKLSRQAAWRLRCSWDGVVRVVDGTSGSCCARILGSDCGA